MKTLFCWLFGHRPVVAEARNGYLDWASGVWWNTRHEWWECRRCRKKLSQVYLVSHRPGVEQ